MLDTKSEAAKRRDSADAGDPAGDGAGGPAGSQAGADRPTEAPRAPLRHGDFTALADDYSRYRPGYSASVLSALLGLIDKPDSEIDAVDVGAGTGLWTRMLAGRGLRSVTAVEPNAAMRAAGMRDSEGLAIDWREGRGEQTGLEAASADLVAMASSFHWVDFAAGMGEFHRILRPGGRFVALWNPRLIEVNPLLVDIENYLKSLKPDMKRVSSGRVGFAETLTERLLATAGFDDVVFLEGRHVKSFTPAEYLGVWRSVNDVQVQMGAARFARFLDYVAERTAHLPAIEAAYLTRAWAVRRAG